MANAQNIRPVPSNPEEVNLEIDDSQNVRQLTEEGQQPPILVLSRDNDLVETVRKAAPRGSRVTNAPDLDHVAEKLPTLRPGVLVADTASAADVASMVAQLTQHFPELVVVVAGKREDSAALMQLTAAGRIFRFLLTPLSHGQTRLALEAALAQHIDLSASAERLSSGNNTAGGGKNYVMTYGALAAGLLVVISGIWFGVKQFAGDSTQPIVAGTAPPTAVGLPEKPDPVKAELALADEAFRQGKYLEPSGESALDLYRSALQIDAESAAAKAGIRSVVDKILEKAEASLTAERLEDAFKTTELARSIDSAHPRLAFLDNQILRERERLKLSQAQDTSNRIRTLVTQANDRMQNRRLIAPQGSSARDALMEARKLDPTDPNVAQATRELVSLLADEGERLVRAGKTDEAQGFVSAGKQLGSADSKLATVERMLVEATRPPPVAPTTVAGTTNVPNNNAGNTRRTNQPNVAAPAAGAGAAIDAMIVEVRQRLQEGRLVDPPGDSARDSLATLRAAAPNRPEVEELARSLSNRLIDSGKKAAEVKAYDRASQLLAAAREVGGRFNELAVSNAERDLLSAREQNAMATNIVSAATLKRTKIVNPAYPESAARRKIEGWVELAFTIQPDGSVVDVEVQNSSPSEVFDKSASTAVKQWRYEPVVRNGQPVPQRAIVRVRFDL